MTERETPYEPALAGEWRKRMEEAFGRAVMRSADCERLAEDIEAKTGQHVGATTVKRWFGYADGGPKSFRRSTYDILARFVGYDGIKQMRQALGDTFEISSYSPTGMVDVSRLEPGTQIRLTYDPGREIEMTLLGDCRFRIDKSVNSKLEEGDEARIVFLAKGFPLTVTELVRGGYELGEYTGAKHSGLTSIEINYSNDTNIN